jgi:hypothetical protein
MELSTEGEATSYAAIREIPIIFWSPRVHYRIHNSSPLGPILNQNSLRNGEGNFILSL